MIFQQKEIRVLGQVFRVLKKICTVSQDVRDFFFEHKTHVVCHIIVDKAINECEVEEGNRVCCLVGHFIGFLSNLVTCAPADSLIPSTVLQMVLESVSIITYISKAHFENNPDEDYEKSFLNASIHTPLLVLLHNSTCKSHELRERLLVSLNG